MTALEYIRSQLGISQQELADHLGITRSLLSKAENKRCRLSSENLIRLAELEIRLKERCAPQNQDTIPAYHTLNYCTKRLRNNIHLIRGFEKRLETMQRKNVVIASLNIEEAIGNRHVARIERRNNLCGMNAQGIVTLKIDLLLSENKILNQYIIDLSKDA